MELYPLFTKGNKAFSVFLYILFCLPFLAQTNKFPHISQLQSRNVLFKQYVQEVEHAYKLLASSSLPVEVMFFTYTAQTQDTLLTLAARCTIPYETLATINRINDNDLVLTGKTLILPTCPGLFLPSDPQSPLEILLAEKYLASDDYLCYNLEGRDFFFIQNARLSSTERAFFLDSGLVLPLPNGVLTSNYGIRKSPITGRTVFHEGVDLAASEGSPVIACKAGSIERTGYSSVYGNYVIIKHDEKTRSFYAHLASISVEAGELVFSKDRIGTVGSTGLSTGIHLHFEILVNGKSIDPGLIIKGIN